MFGCVGLGRERKGRVVFSEEERQMGRRKCGRERLSRGSEAQGEVAEVEGGVLRVVSGGFGLREKAKMISRDVQYRSGWRGSRFYVVRAFT